MLAGSQLGSLGWAGLPPPRVKGINDIPILITEQAGNKGHVFFRGAGGFQSTCQIKYFISIK